MLAGPFYQTGGKMGQAAAYHNVISLFSTKRNVEISPCSKLKMTLIGVWSCPEVDQIT